MTRKLRCRNKLVKLLVWSGGWGENVEKSLIKRGERPTCETAEVGVRHNVDKSLIKMG